MKKFFLPVFITTLLFVLPTEKNLYANEPDSAYLFAYGEENGSGLYFAGASTNCNGMPSVITTPF